MPQVCSLCGNDSGNRGICQPCNDELPWTSANCTICALPLPQSTVCGSCLKTPPAFDHTIAAWRYEWPLDRLIPAYKYRGKLVLATSLAQGLAVSITNDDRPDLLVAMPLHAKRLRERGFNQSSVLAQRLAGDLGIPHRHDVVTRIKLTPPQASLSVMERHKQLRGAFRCDADVAGLHIAIVDDVMTSGASLNELAKVLKAAGAARVDCWVLARTPHK